MDIKKEIDTEKDGEGNNGITPGIHDEGDDGGRSARRAWHRSRPGCITDLDSAHFYPLWYLIKSLRRQKMEFRKNWHMPVI